MRNIPKERFIATTVVIEFEDGPVSFGIQRGTTLAEISEDLDKAGKWHKGHPLSINVHFKAQIDRRRGGGRAHALTLPTVSQLGGTPDYLPAYPDR
jgi:hypothetical protein